MTTEQTEVIEVTPLTVNPTGAGRFAIEVSSNELAALRAVCDMPDFMGNEDEGMRHTAARLRVAIDSI